MCCLVWCVQAVVLFFFSNSREGGVCADETVKGVAVETKNHKKSIQKKKSLQRKRMADRDGMGGIEAARCRKMGRGAVGQ